MRLNRLELIRYGKFTDRMLDFGPREQGKADFHLIYGPNEAGKSTLFSAWLDLLYGMAPQSPYAFLHPYATMRIGAEIDVAGATKQIFRIKRPQNSLLDAHDRPVGENFLAGDLGGLARDAYAAMFSLDDRQLEDGGEDILRAKGDLGQLLFSGSSGLADLGRRIADLRAEADGFFRPRAHNTGLALLTQELAELDAAREKADVQAAEFHARVEALETSTERLEAATRRRAALRARHEAIERLLTARPSYGQWRQLRNEAQTLDEIPTPPAHWAAELMQLRSEALRLEIETAQNAEARQKAEQAAARTPDRAALALGAEAEDWDLPRSRDLTAIQDTPRLEAQLRELEFTQAMILAALGRKDEAAPARLVLPAASVAALRALLERRSGVDRALEQAKKARDEAEESLAIARKNFSPEGPDDAEAAAALAAALADLRASAHGFRLAEAVKQAEAARREHEARQAALTPWSGAAQALAALIPPGAEDLADWKARALALQSRRAALSDQIARLEAERAHHGAACAALTADTGLPSDEEAAALRAVRDAAWRRHREDLDAASADQFEQELRRDDAAGARRFAALAELAQLRDASRQLQIVEADLQAAQKNLTQTSQAQQALDAEFLAALEKIFGAPPPAWRVSQLQSWLERREAALIAQGKHQDAEQLLAATRAEGAALRQKLDAALRAMNHSTEGDDAAALRRAEQALSARAEAQQRRKEADQRAADLARQHKALERAESALAGWREDFRAATANNWLGEQGPPSPAEVRAALDHNEKLVAALNEHKNLQARLEGMARDRAAFRALVAQKAGKLGLQPENDFDPRALDREILSRIRAAENAAAELLKAQKTLADLAADAAALHKAQQIFERQKREMTEFFAVGALDEVEERLAQAARRENLLGQAKTLEKTLLDTLRAGDFAEVEAALADLDVAGLRIEAEQIGGDSEAAEAEWRQALSAHDEARRKREEIGGDEAAALLDQRRRVLLGEIEAGAQKYLRQRAGEIAAEQALRLYREKHRSAMMASASQALALISRGAYVRLAAQPKGDSEILMAISAEGASKAAETLSKGARFQLYLALRVAGFFEFAKTRPPPPFVADDILESFDNFRAEETLKLFGEMAKQGQLVYLTHHAHLLDIARAVCPDVRIHELD